MKHYRPEFKPGDWVASHFRANWKGVVEEVFQQTVDCPSGRYNNITCQVRVLVDRHNNPIRKPFSKILHQNWLTACNNPNENVTG